MSERKIFEPAIEEALQTLRSGGTILYPTDTVWGLGCSALDGEAVAKIYRIKQREESKSLIILVAEERDILKYVAAPDIAVFDFMARQQKPTTLIFDGAIGLPRNIIAGDGSVAVRMVQDEFCRHLIKRLRAPLVSTSANISGEPTPQTFAQVSDRVKTGVDYIVPWRQEETAPAQPSRIIKWKGNGLYDVIRP